MIYCHLAHAKKNDLVSQIQDLQIIPNSLAIWGLGQMGIVIKGPDATIYSDPCLSDILAERSGKWWARAFEPPIDPSTITNADFYLITHEHRDHLDPLTIRPVSEASPQAKFVTNGWCKVLLHNLEIEDDRIIIPPAMTTTTLPVSRGYCKTTQNSWR